MESLAGFKDIAPYLTQPLVLVGFVLLIVFGVHRALLKAHVISPLPPRASGTVVQSFLKYGFVIALVAIVLGFALAFYQTPPAIDQTPPAIEQKATAKESGTAINAGRDVTYGVPPASPPSPGQSAALPGTAKQPPLPINQNATAESGGTAINSGGDVTIRK